LVNSYSVVSEAEKVD